MVFRPGAVCVTTELLLRKRTKMKKRYLYCLFASLVLRYTHIYLSILIKFTHETFCRRLLIRLIYITWMFLILYVWLCIANNNIHNSQLFGNVEQMIFHPFILFVFSILTYIKWHTYNFVAFETYSNYFFASI